MELRCNYAQEELKFHCPPCRERLATGVILSELRSQAQGVQLPMAIKSRSFSQPTPS